MTMPQNPLVVIPARMSATRLPGKPLLDLCGAPMIVQVWRRAAEAQVGRVVVACGETEIAEAVRAAGGEAVLTDPDLPSGSDRVFAAVSALDGERHHDVVLNLQGDLPTIAPDVVRRVVEALADPAVDIATAVCPISDPSERDNPNVVKAVVSWSADPAVGRGLYFSRTAVPSGEGTLYHHIGLYGFRRAALEHFVALPQSQLEQRERLEQLRALEDGMVIACARVDTIPLGVDTAEDLARARKLLASRAS